MKSLAVALACASILAAPAAWAQNISTGAFRNTGLDQLLDELKSSTDDIKTQGLGQILSQSAPKSEKDMKLLLEALKDKTAAPYAQLAITKTADPALGAFLYEKFKEMKADLQHIPRKEFVRLSRTEQERVLMRAMNIAAVAHALGNLKYQAATSDLRDLLNYDEEFEGYPAKAALYALRNMEDDATFKIWMERFNKKPSPEIVQGYGTKAVRKIIAKIETIDATYKVNPRKPNDPREEEIDKLIEELAWKSRKDKESKLVMQELLHHPNKNVQIAAAANLASSLVPNDKDIAREMLQHNEPLVRMTGLHSLRTAKTWDKSFLPMLIDMIQHDPDYGVRGTAIDELGSLIMIGVRRKDLQEAVPFLEAALNDPHVNIHAFLTLRRLTGRFYSYEGMSEAEKRIMEVSPKFLPEPSEESIRANEENK